MILHTTSLQAALGLQASAKATGKRRYPVFLKITEDHITPVAAFLTLRRQAGRQAFLYESVEGGERTSRWSFLGVNPFLRFCCTGFTWTCDPLTADATLPTGLPNDPKLALQLLLDAHAALSVADLPSPFIGGAVGNFGYDAVRLVEPTIPDTGRDDFHLPDISLLLFNQVIAFDHVFKAIYLIETLPVESLDPQADYQAALTRLSLTEWTLRQSDVAAVTACEVLADAQVSCNLTQPEYEAMVREAKEQIANGEIFQVVLALRFSTTLHVDPFTVYRGLRARNPAPYQFFVDFGEWQLIGASPEILVSVEQQPTGQPRVKICPIAGTRPRLHDAQRDRQLEAELLTDPKERAEHLMLVDLARNDASRVCIPGSVVAEPLMYIERYATVVHIVSDVVGLLREGLHPLDAIWASLPAGTLSGAPKIRAMGLIDQLEPTRRGPYGGCVGFIGFDGNITTAIVIRTALTLNDQVYWQAGAGIVADSNPTTEYRECCQKARSILLALALVGNTPCN